MYESGFIADSCGRTSHIDLLLPDPLNRASRSKGRWRANLGAGNPFCNSFKDKDMEWATGLWGDFTGLELRYLTQLCVISITHLSD
jgi:hypothetical protein